MTLADGMEHGFRYFIVTVMWNGSPRIIRAHVADGTPLVGMSLLRRHSLLVEVVEGGRVAIQTLG